MPIDPFVINVNNAPFLKNCEPTSMFLPYFVDDKMWKNNKKHMKNAVINLIKLPLCPKLIKLNFYYEF